MSVLGNPSIQPAPTSRKKFGWQLPTGVQHSSIRMLSIPYAIDSTMPPWVIGRSVSLERANRKQMKWYSNSYQEPLQIRSSTVNFLQTA